MGHGCDLHEWLDRTSSARTLMIRVQSSHSLPILDSPPKSIGRSVPIMMNASRDYMRSSCRLPYNPSAGARLSRHVDRANAASKESAFRVTRKNVGAICSATLRARDYLSLTSPVPFSIEPMIIGFSPERLRIFIMRSA